MSNCDIERCWRKKITSVTIAIAIKRKISYYIEEGNAIPFLRKPQKMFGERESYDDIHWRIKKVRKETRELPVDEMPERQSWISIPLNCISPSHFYFLYIFKYIKGSWFARRWSSFEIGRRYAKTTLKAKNARDFQFSFKSQIVRMWNWS